MLILTPHQHYVFRGREDSPSDHLVVRETWVENVYRITKSDLADTKVVVDVGANIGAVSVWAASLGARHVLAVEPDPDNRELLTANIKSNGCTKQCTVVPVAVSDTAEQVNFAPGHGHSRIDPDGPIQVHTLSLEEILAEHKITYADVLKIDIEGHEYRVIESTPTDVLRKFRFLTVEFDAADDDTFGLFVAKLAHHFSVEILGSPARGGYVYARRYD